MASRDPFDDVLKALGLDQDVQNIPSAVLGMQGIAQQVSCQIRVTDIAGNLATIQQAPPAIRIGWALKLIKFIHPTPANAIQIRPMNLILILDGTVQVVLAGNSINPYPARYRIPASTIMSLPLQERVWRAEKFALGTLLYEIFTGHKPFQGLSDDAVQGLYKEADFPQELNVVQPLCLQSLIYACWSAEFGRHITLGRFHRYVVDNPIRFSLQVTGAVVGTAALITVPILGLVGFSSIGPVAGSLAASWQAAIGAVEAGSLFALCQSAAMGGVAAAGLAVTGAAGGAVAVVATPLPGAADLRSMFTQKFKRT